MIITLFPCDNANEHLPGGLNFPIRYNALLYTEMFISGVGYTMSTDRELPEIMALWQKKEAHRVAFRPADFSAYWIATQWA